MKSENEKVILSKNGVKKFTCIVAILIVVISIGAFLIGCKKMPNDILIVAPDGATALSVAKLVENKIIDKTNIKVKIVAPSEIATESLKADFAVVPANVAANLYNKGSDIKILDVVTNGNLYILSSLNKEVELSSLLGKMIYSIGQGSLPDLLFQSILNKNNLLINFGDVAVDGKVTIAYSADGSEVIAKLMKAKQQNKEVYGLLAEPAVSMAMGKDLIQKFDLQELWKEQTKSDTNGYPQAVLIVSGKIANNKKLISNIRDIIVDNSNWLEENSARAVENIKSVYPQTSLSNNINKLIVKRCNINTLSIKENKDYYVNMLTAIMEINNGAAIGGKLPNSGFYY